MFTLFLKSYDVNIKNVIRAFRKLIQNLNQEINLKINDVTNTIWVFIMTFFGDMSQQADNGGFIRYIVIIKCRICFCLKNKRVNLKFDIIIKRRYH